LACAALSKSFSIVALAAIDAFLTERAISGESCALD